MTRIYFLSYVCPVQSFNPFNITIMKIKLTFETIAAAVFGSAIIGGFVAVVVTLLF